MNIGVRVREAREDLGMSQAELARRTGVARNHIVMIEHGGRTPSVGLLEKIAHELRTEPAELLREPVPLAEASETGQPEEVVRDPEEVVRDLAEVAQEVLPLIDELYEQERSHSAPLDASEGIPQVFFAHAESKIFDLFSDLHRDAAPQVLAMVGLYYRRKVAQLEEEENATQRAADKREGARR